MLEIHIAPSSRDLPPQLSREEWHAAVQEAAASWVDASAACPELKLVVDPLSPERRADADGINLVVFRAESWCHNERCGGLATYPGPAVGMTTTYPPSATGRDIKEADIELNAVRFWFRAGNDGSVPAPPEATGKRVASLQATLVHELGHVLGLPDACDSHAKSGALRGADCPVAARDSVMFAPAHLEQPTPADVDSLCALLTGRSEPVNVNAGSAVNWTFVGLGVLFVVCWAFAWLGVRVVGRLCGRSRCSRPAPHPEAPHPEAP